MFDVTIETMCSNGNVTPDLARISRLASQIACMCSDYCEYKGRQYSQGQKWDDGCEFTCECIDEGTGKYQCLEKYVTYTHIISVYSGSVV